MAYKVILPEYITSVSQLTIFHPATGNNEELGTTCFMFQQNECVSPLIPEPGVLWITPRLDWMCSVAEDDTTGLFYINESVHGKLIAYFNAQPLNWCDTTNIIWNQPTDTSLNQQSARLVFFLFFSVLIPVIGLLCLKQLECDCCVHKKVTNGRSALILLDDDDDDNDDYENKNNK